MDYSRNHSEGLIRRVFLFLFILSGFSGLIYQSIWTHYLKLFLGHASYAQTLVLAIFMGGMALGSWAASAWTAKLTRPLLAYALAEGAVGLLALVFHRVFVGLTDWSYDHVIPAIGSATMIEVWKWSLAGLLILPQSILLGATFPFMTAGLLRRLDDNKGRLIAGLYFANSLGAAVGILIAGFVLIAKIGLPGTVMTAGVINILLALVVYIIVRSDQHQQQSTISTQNGKISTSNIQIPVKALLAVSMLTGLASFFYEIGWIRMLAMVLGSSTHAFELMLSAFISGIALGGFWVRRHIDRLTAPLTSLALIQLFMGILAIATLSIYGETFNAMHYALDALQKTDAGYRFYNFYSHILALGVMLPATICAGMTLPIITHLLLTSNTGEAAIGRVYAVNTIGAILGVFLAIQLILPVFGLKALILAGGVIDIALGFWLLTLDKEHPNKKLFSIAAALSLLFIAYTYAFVELDTRKMAGGAFDKRFKLDDDQNVIFHHDGKTATVDVVTLNTLRTIRTNGKTDAGLFTDHDKASPDETTMTLAVALPLMMNPSIQTVGVIGMGSGMSTDSALKFPGIQRVDTIEIEPGMIEGAKHMGPKVQQTFSDPRSHIHIADAKTYFTNEQMKYDLIMSEPSNPWVSGVSGLFSEEFYKRIANHLSGGGIFAQWFHVYDMSMPLTASVAKALKKTFPHFRIYVTAEADIVFLASMQELPQAKLHALAGSELHNRLKSLGILSQTDVDWAYIGNQNYIGPLFESYPVPVNSDYYPYLDQNATEARFLSLNALNIISDLPEVIRDIDNTSPQLSRGTNPLHPFPHARKAFAAEQGLAYWQNLELGNTRLPSNVARSLLIAIQQTRAPLTISPDQCDETTAQLIWLPALMELNRATKPFLPTTEMKQILTRLYDIPCLPAWPHKYKLWLDVLTAESTRDDQRAISAGMQLLPSDNAIPPSPLNDELLRILLSAHIRSNQLQEARGLWDRYQGRGDPSLALRTLAAYVFANTKSATQP